MATWLIHGTIVLGYKKLTAPFLVPRKALEPLASGPKALFQSSAPPKAATYYYAPPIYPFCLQLWVVNCCRRTFLSSSDMDDVEP